VSPLVLGSGKRLFRNGGDSRRLELVEATPTPKGNVILAYRPIRA
jgi:dihydrofolate reductase